MNTSDITPSDASDERPADNQPPKTGLPIESEPPAVPAFGCIVYFAREGGVFHGRVANLAGIEVSAPSQRDMLGQIVARFKSAVAGSLTEGQTPAWIDPPDQKRPGETKLFLPVHL